MSGTIFEMGFWFANKNRVRFKLRVSIFCCWKCYTSKNPNLFDAQVQCCRALQTAGEMYRLGKGPTKTPKLRSFTDKALPPYRRISGHLMKQMQCHKGLDHCSFVGLKTLKNQSFEGGVGF